MLVLVPIYSEIGNYLTKISPLRQDINNYESEFNEAADVYDEQIVRQGTVKKHYVYGYSIPPSINP